jgi:hypothetical protein
MLINRGGDADHCKNEECGKDASRFIFRKARDTDDESEGKCRNLESQEFDGFGVFVRQCNDDADTDCSGENETREDAFGFTAYKTRDADNRQEGECHQQKTPGLRLGRL